MQIEIRDSVQSVRLDSQTNGLLPFERLGGQFFSEIVRLPPGTYVAKVQIMFSEHAAGELVQIGARLSSDGAELDRLELTAIPQNRTRSDDLYLNIEVDEEHSVEIFGHVSANCSTTLLRYITIVSTEGGSAKAEDFYFQEGAPRLISDLECVIFGTTAVCNASCLHCPTNKEHRRGLPNGFMGFEVFSKILRQLSEEDYKGWFLFGLFGEPLEDPLLEQRLLLIKKVLPRASISIATNCGVYDPNKHAFIVELADDIGVHVEAVSPEVYNRFMHPLRADRVFPKIVSLLSIDKNSKVHITTPAHKGNLAEIPNIRAYFKRFSAREPHFTQIGNRSWEGGPWSRLSLAPVGGWCAPSSLRTFVIDWDGAVLACCRDFSKSAKLGDLTTQTIREVLNGQPWLNMVDIHRTKSWTRREGCARCRGDSYDATQTIIQPLLALSDRAQSFAASDFKTVPGVLQQAEGKTSVAKEIPDGVVVYGPYRRLAPGHYRVSHFVEVTKVGTSKASMELDIVKDGVEQIAVRNFPIATVGPVELDLEFRADGAVTEFRVAKKDLDFVHKGAIVRQITH
jgi:radical SAM protein with 4Fe4S-binding SPASM domain